MSTLFYCNTMGSIEVAGVSVLGEGVILNRIVASQTKKNTKQAESKIKAIAQYFEALKPQRLVTQNLLNQRTPKGCQDPSNPKPTKESCDLRNGVHDGQDLFWDSKVSESQSQRVHVGIWYTPRAQWGSRITILRPKYLPYNYMDPLGVVWG